jgi:hypothetical protein
MTPEALKAAATLYQPRPAIRWRREPSRGNIYGAGSQRFQGENPPEGAQIVYSLTKKADKIGLKIMDVTGQTLRELQAPSAPGLHVVRWDLQAQPPRGDGQRQGQGPGRGGRGGSETRTRASAPTAVGPRGPVSSGTYRVVLTVDGQEFTQPLRVETDPTLPPGSIRADILDAAPDRAEIDETLREGRLHRDEIDR